MCDSPFFLCTKKAAAHDLCATAPTASSILIDVHAHSRQTASKVPVEQTEQTIFGQQAGDLFRQRVDIAREMIRAHGKPDCGS